MVRLSDIFESPNIGAEYSTGPITQPQPGLTAQSERVAVDVNDERDEPYTIDI